MQHSIPEDMNRLVESSADQEVLLKQLLSALCPSTADAGTSVPLVADVGNILLQLSVAVAEAKSETEKERMMRLALQRENEEIRSKQQFLFSEGSSTAEEESSGYSFTYPATVASSFSESLTDSALSLSDCLSLMATLSHPELVYMSYYGAGMFDLDLSRVERIYKPYDYSHLVFIVFNSYDVMIPSDFVPFSLANIEALFGSSITPPSLASTPSPKDSEDEAPRMNLLEALNVQSDDDCARIVTVRKCHKLGFKSHVHLRQYFARFGKVERVVLLPMRAKPKSTLDGRGNRPSSMGFVVMESRDSVEKILNYNNSCGVHEIKGWPIEVRNFVKPADKPESGLSSSLFPPIVVADESTNVW